MDEEKRQRQQEAEARLIAAIEKRTQEGLAQIDSPERAGLPFNKEEIFAVVWTNQFADIRSEIEAVHGEGLLDFRRAGDDEERLANVLQPYRARMVEILEPLRMPDKEHPTSA